MTNNNLRSLSMMHNFSEEHDNKYQVLDPYNQNAKTVERDDNNNKSDEPDKPDKSSKSKESSKPSKKNMSSKYPRFSFRLSKKDKSKLKYFAYKNHETMAGYIKSQTLAPNNSWNGALIKKFNVILNQLQMIKKSVQLHMNSDSEGMSNINQIAKKINQNDVKNISVNNIYINNISVNDILVELKTNQKYLNRIVENMIKIEGELINGDKN